MNGTIVMCECTGGYEGARCTERDDEFPTLIDRALIGTLAACVAGAIIITLFIFIAKSRSAEGKKICC